MRSWIRRCASAWRSAGVIFARFGAGDTAGIGGAGGGLSIDVVGAAGGGGGGERAAGGLRGRS